MANILPDGGRGTGPDPWGTNYPFLDPGTDTRGLLADMSLSHELRDAQLPLRVTRLAHFGAAFLGQSQRCEVRVLDQADTVVFDSTQSIDYQAAPFGTRLKLHQWITPGAICRVLQHTAFPDSQSVVAWPAEIVPQDGRLDERVAAIVPKRVARLSDPETGAAARGDIVFVNGYNTTIAVTTPPGALRVRSRLTFSAQAASGLGRYPGCATPDLVLRSINGAKPGANGDLSLAAAGCYWVRQPSTLSGSPQVATLTPGTLNLGNDCGPCCECADFVAVQLGTLQTWDRMRQVATDAESIRDQFAQVVTLWNEEKACVEAKVVQGTLAPYGGQYVEVQVTVCNHTQECLLDTTLSLTFATSAAGGGSVMAGTTRISDIRRGMVPYALSGSWPDYTAYFDAIQAMSAGVLRTRLLIPGAIAGTDISLQANATTGRPLLGLQLPQAITVIATFGSV